MTQQSSETVHVSRHLFALYRHVTCIFWGAVLAFALGYGVLTLPFFQARAWPAFFAGVVPVAWGLGGLTRTLAPTHMAPAARRTLGLTLLVLYFAPFHLWWRHTPHDYYLLAHMVLLFFAFASAMAAFNQLMAGLAGLLGEAGWREHASLAFWATTLLLIVPAALLLASALQGTLRHGDHPWLVLRSLLMRLPWWVVMLPAIPIALSMATCWHGSLRLKERLAACAMQKTAADQDSRSTPRNY